MVENPDLQIRNSKKEGHLKSFQIIVDILSWY